MVELTTCCCMQSNNNNKTDLGEIRSKSLIGELQYVIMTNKRTKMIAILLKQSIQLLSLA